MTESSAERFKRADAIFDAALDIDLSASPLFNILPIRRLGLQDAAPGTSHFPRPSMRSPPS